MLRIFATAPLRGEGVTTLGQLGTLVQEPWITGPTDPMTILGETQLAEKIQALEADVVICEADSCKGPVLDLPLQAICSTRGDPSNVDVAGATAKGIPVLHAPGSQRRWRGRAGPRAPARREPTPVAGGRRRAPGRRVQGRHDPLPTIPRLAARRSYRRPGRSRCGGSRHEVAAGRNRHAGHLLRPVQP